MRSAALAKIHIARKDLGLEETDYRAILTRVAGVKSASDLDADGQAKVLAEFTRLGWTAKQRRPKSGKAGVRLIFGLWSELGRTGFVRNASRQALLAFVERQTGVADPEWLSPTQINTVVEGLKAMRARAKSKSVTGHE